MRIITLLVCFMFFGLLSCQKESPLVVETFVGTIDSIIPSSGSSGDTLLIKGKRFGTSLNNIRAFVNGKGATIVALEDTLMRVIVPLRAGTGLVSIAGGTGGVSGPLFQFSYRAKVEWYVGSMGVSGFADGLGSQSKFNEPSGLASDPLGNLYVADQGNHRVRRISPGGGVLAIAGDGQQGHADGPGPSARFNFPSGLSYDPFTNELYVADRMNHCIRKVTQQGNVLTVAGIPGVAGFVDAPGASARFNQPFSVAFDPNYSDLYIGDSQNHSLRKLSIQQVVNTFAGNGSPGNNNGQGSTATFNLPYGLLIDSVYRIVISDKANHNIRTLGRVDANSEIFSGTGFAGFSNGTSILASFNGPMGMCWFEDKILVADQLNHSIRMVFKTGEVVTLAGDGTPGTQNGTGSLARFNSPVSIAPGFEEGEFFVSDSGNHVIRRVVIE